MSDLFLWLTILVTGGFLALAAIGWGSYLIWKDYSKKEEEKTMEVKTLQGATPAVVELNTLEAKPFSGWDLKVQGEATVLVGDNVAITGPIVALAPVAA